MHPDNGNILWQYPWVTENQCNIASPIVVEDYVFISSYYGRAVPCSKSTRSATIGCDLVYKTFACASR